jgi:hypothetical protein
MKKIYQLKVWYAAGLIAGLAMLINACKNYLDVKPQGVTSQDQLITDPNAATNLVTGVYNILWIGGFEPDIHSLEYVVMTDIASDDADKGSSPTDYPDALQIDNLQTTPNNGIINNIWAGYYQGIARANQALTYLESSQIDATLKNRLIGEVRFLRAYFYFNLVRFFGGVPLVDKVPAASDVNSPQYQTRASAADIYSFIISDLDFAIANLPLKSAAETGRATLGAAQTLEAKVYLYQKDYQKAYDLTQAVITSGQYSLYADYARLFRQEGNNSPESIFEIQAGTNTACNAAIHLFVVSQGPRAGGARGWTDLGFGFNNPSQSLINEYEANDRRKNGTVIFIQPSPQGTVLYDGFRVPSKDSVENSTYNYKAYHSRTTEENCGNNDYLPKHVKVLRYAEVLLIHAEAAFLLGRAGDAVNDLTQVRTRAGLGAPAVVNLAAIWHERRMELAEEGDRFFDIVRQDAVQPGRAATAFAAHGKTWSADKAVFPIPQPQIDLSGGKLTQNPGY